MECWSLGHRLPILPSLNLGRLASFVINSIHGHYDGQYTCWQRHTDYDWLGLAVRNVL